MKNILLFILILIIGPIIFGQDTTIINDYFPLQVGNEWNYVWTIINHGDEYQEKVVDTLFVNTKKYFQVEVYYIDGTIDIDTLSNDTLGRIWIYNKGFEHIILDFSEHCDSNYISYIHNDTLLYRPVSFSNYTVGLKDYTNCRGFYISSPLDTTHYVLNIYAPGVGLIKQDHEYGGHPKVITKSYLLNNIYTTNFMEFSPTSDTIEIGYDFPPPKIKLDLVQSGSIDNLLITAADTETQMGYPNYLAQPGLMIDTCQISLLNIFQDNSYELWYEPVDPEYSRDSVSYIVPMDSIFEIPNYLYTSGSFNFKLYVFRDSVKTDSLTQLFYINRYGMAIEEEPTVNQFYLSQNYPNPFNPITTISYTLPQRSKVNLSIYDIRGKLVEVVENDMKNAGNYHILWNASNYASGIYFYKIEAGDFMDLRKCLLVK